MNKIKEHYDKLYAENETVFGGGRADGIVRDILKYKQAGSVLEIGAGEGRNSLFLTGNGFDVEAIDISDKGISKLKKIAKDKNLKIKTHVADVGSFIPDKNYDVIVSTFVFHHLPREKALSVINMIRNKTEPGGINAIASFTKDGDFYKDNPDADRFYLEKEELKELYKDWEILEYNEEKGMAFQKREDGSPMFNVSARILAKKPDNS